MTAYEQATATPQVAESATQAASEVVSTAKDQAGQVASEAKAQLGDLTSQAREQVAQQVSAQQGKAAAQVRSFADQLQSLSRGETTEGGAADAVRQLGETVQRVADKLEQTEPQQLLADVKRYARNHPGTFLLGAAFAGFMSGRLVKAATTGGGTEAPPPYGGREAYPTEPLGARSLTTEPLGTPSAAYATESGVGMTFDSDDAYPAEPRRTDTGGLI